MKRSKSGPLSVIERHAAVLFRNRFIWLAWSLALYLNLHLTFLYLRGEAFLRREWEMWQAMMVVIELGLLATLLLLIIGLPQIRRAWRKRFPKEPFSYIMHGLASMLVLPVGLALMLVPLLFLHSFPNEASVGINIPLMLLQRALVVLMVVTLVFNFCMLLRLYLSLPYWLVGGLGVIGQLLLGYWLTFLSFNSPLFAPYNDVFFYNQLWRYFDRFPNLQNSGVFSRINLVSQPGEQAIIGYAVMIGLGIISIIVVMLLWFPRASIVASKQSTEANH